MGDLDIGAMLTRILPLLDYYITFFTDLLTKFAASMGFDLDAMMGNAAENADNNRIVS